MTKATNHVYIDILNIYINYANKKGEKIVKLTQINITYNKTCVK